MNNKFSIMYNNCAQFLKKYALLGLLVVVATIAVISYQFIHNQSINSHILDTSSRDEVVSGTGGTNNVIKFTAEPAARVLPNSGIELVLSNGEVQRFLNIKPVLPQDYGYKNYSYIGYIKELDKYLIAVEGYESHESLLVSRRTGATISVQAGSMNSYSIIKKGSVAYFASINNDPAEIAGRHGIQIITINMQTDESVRIYQTSDDMTEWEFTGISAVGNSFRVQLVQYPSGVYSNNGSGRQARTMQFEVQSDDTIRVVSFDKRTD